MSDIQGWKPIKTAPREGCYVDLWIPSMSCGYGRIPDCKWLDNERQPGWYAEYDDGYYDGAYYVGDSATHWMHRPEPPK